MSTSNEQSVARFGFHPSRRTKRPEDRRQAARRASLLSRCPAVVDALERRVMLSAVVQSAFGANAAAITAARDAFRVDLGGGTVVGLNGSFGGLRREINWDDVPALLAAPNALPADSFNTSTSARGVVFSAPGTGFEVSSDPADAGAGQPAAPRFGDINATYSTAFGTFSVQRLFTPKGSNVTDVTFFIPGTTTPATTTGFGSVFTDVDTANTTSIEYFDESNASLGTFFAAASAGDASLSFLGVSFNAGERVSRVQITTGAAALGLDDVTQNPSNADVVAMDDFIYGDPSAFIVTNTNDSGVGSLRQAITNSNDVPGKQTISFNISGGGVQTISPMSSLPTITDPVVIDGYTQPGSSANTLAAGNNAVINIALNGAGAGLAVNGLTITGGMSRVQGLSIGGFILEDTEPDSIIGGGNGIVLTGSGGNVIAGNFIGNTDATKTDVSRNGIVIQSDGNTVGGTDAGARNIISGNAQTGILIERLTAARNLVQGNFIGTDATGSHSLADSAGVIINGNLNNVIGGTTAGARNIISGNSFQGVVIANTARGNKVQGNFIGTDVTGAAAVGNGLVGVQVTGAASNVIGGSLAAANLIAFNGVGVNVNGNAVSVLIRFNSIFSNGGLGIDLNGVGVSPQIEGLVTPNDPNDEDAAFESNHLQNFPVLTSAVSDGLNTTVSGVINTNANVALVIDFYDNDQPDPSGFGEGQTYIGSVPVALNSFGNNATFSGTFPFAVPAGHFITATATNVGTAPYGDTSEFSQAIDVTSSAPPPAPTLSINDVALTEGNSATKNFTFTVTRSSTVGTSSVNFTTANGSAAAGSDYTAKAGTLSFANGDASKTITVVVKGDTTVETNENFFVNLSSPLGATLADGKGVGTVGNDDASGPPPVITVNDISANEGNSATKNFTFTVKLSKSWALPVTVHFNTQNGTAAANSDYISGTGTLTIPAGSLSGTVAVQVKGDTAIEGNETFFLKLATPTNATIGDNSGTATIVNDDPFPAINPHITVNDVSITEGSSGTKLLTFTVKLNQATSKTVSVNYTTTDGTAKAADNDYVSKSGTLTFTAGQTSLTISIVIKGDTKHEANEAMGLLLSAPVNATIDDAIGLGTIVTDD